MLYSGAGICLYFRRHERQQQDLQNAFGRRISASDGGREVRVLGGSNQNTCRSKGCSGATSPASASSAKARFLALSRTCFGPARRGLGLLGAIAFRVCSLSRWPRMCIMLNPRTGNQTHARSSYSTPPARRMRSTTWPWFRWRAIRSAVSPSGLRRLISTSACSSARAASVWPLRAASMSAV